LKIFQAIGTGLSTILIYLGLPLLGWGLGGLQEFFAPGYRTGFAAAVVAFGAAIGWQYVVAPDGIQGSKGDPTRLVRRQTIVGFSMSMILFLALLFLPYADRREIGTMDANLAVQWSGLALCTLGVVLIFWSGLALGKMYSADVTLQKDHHLVTGGLYRFIRHPRYLGNILLALGIAFLFRSWIGLALVPFILALLLFRIHDEEALMHQQFGDEWEQYCQRSWRLIPLLF